MAARELGTVSKVDIGRIGENIVANDLLERGFLVTHLDKGSRGVSANADLLVGHEQLTEPILIQVKACYAPRLQRVFFGGFPSQILDGEGSLFNSKPGFHADFIVTVSIKSPKDYRVFVIPVQLAERLLTTAFKKWHEVPIKSNERRRPVPTMYVSVRSKSEWTKIRPAAKATFRPLWEAVLARENAYSLLLNSSGRLEDIPSLLNSERLAKSETAPAA